MTNEKKRTPNPLLGVGIALGVAIGAGVGVALGNVAIGVGIGLAFGIAFGVALGSKRVRDADSSSRRDEERNP